MASTISVSFICRPAKRFRSIGRLPADLLTLLLEQSFAIDFDRKANPIDNDAGFVKLNSVRERQLEGQQQSIARLVWWQGEIVFDTRRFSDGEWMLEEPVLFHTTRYCRPADFTRQDLVRLR